MTNHRTTLVGHDDSWQAKCSCGWRSNVVTRTNADDYQFQHMEHVRRARAGMRRQPSMEETLAWYTEQAANSANSPEEREQWRRLAEELNHRVGKSDSDTPLWE